MKATVLDYNMFDDGSLDCKTVGLAHDEGTDLYSGFSYLKTICESEVYAELMDLIKRRESKGMRWLAVSHYNIYFGGVQLLEIQWD